MLLVVSSGENSHGTSKEYCEAFTVKLHISDSNADDSFTVTRFYLVFESLGNSYDGSRKQIFRIFYVSFLILS